MPDAPVLPDLDIAIIGGGVSGIYAAWRLLGANLGGTRLGSWATARGKLKVTVFEGSDRVGGRLMSARSRHMPDAICEIGGMRYVFPNQKLATGLIERELGLTYHQQVVDDPANIAFLRGQVLRCRDLGNPTALPYRLDQPEAAWVAARGAAPAGLIGRVLLQLMPGLAAALGRDGLQEFLRDVQIDGTPLYKHGFWNLLARGMSQDAYEAARATIGYDCLGGNYNALNLTAEYFDFTPEVQYRMVDGGYEAVPWSLAQRVEKAGGTVETGRWLDGFDLATLPDGTTGVTLRFLDDAEGHEGARREVTARAVILAMPRRAIELLRPEGPVLGPGAEHVRGLLGAVTAVPLHKLFMVYQSPWWADAGVSRGRSLTDLPLRQCYYWPNGAAGAIRPGGPAAVMAYDDLLNVGFWTGLQQARDSARPSLHPQAARRHRAAASLAPPTWFQRHAAVAPPADAFGRRLLTNWEHHRAPDTMVRETHRQLLAMHGIDDAPAPIDAAFIDWADDPFGGGVHFWNVGYRSWEVEKTMTQPVEGFPCYICGEAYSATDQTWIEAALNTAEIVLQQRLGLAAPGWQHD
jgi:hypothetical protein